MRYWVTGVLQ